WRFHDHWHMRKPDGIEAGMVHALGWEKYQSPQNQFLFVMPETTVLKLAQEVAKKLDSPVVRVVGEPGMKVTKVGLSPGASGFQAETHALESDAVEVLLVGETREWETVEYTADAVTQKRKKALIVIGHVPSEQAGMEECTRWLKGFVTVRQANSSAKTVCGRGLICKSRDRRFQKCTSKRHPGRSNSGSVFFCGLLFDGFDGGKIEDRALTGFDAGDIRERACGFDSLVGKSFEFCGVNVNDFHGTDLLAFDGHGGVEFDGPPRGFTADGHDASEFALDRKLIGFRGFVGLGEVKSGEAEEDQ